MKMLIQLCLFVQLVLCVQGIVCAQNFDHKSTLAPWKSELTSSLLHTKQYYLAENKKDLYFSEGQILYHLDLETGEYFEMEEQRVVALWERQKNNPQLFELIRQGPIPTSRLIRGFNALSYLSHWNKTVDVDHQGLLNIMSDYLEYLNGVKNTLNGEGFLIETLLKNLPLVIEAIERSQQLYQAKILDFNQQISLYEQWKARMQTVPQSPLDSRDTQAMILSSGRNDFQETLRVLMSSGFWEFVPGEPAFVLVKLRIKGGFFQRVEPQRMDDYLKHGMVKLSHLNNLFFLPNLRPKEPNGDQKFVFTGHHDRENLESILTHLYLKSAYPQKMIYIAGTHEFETLLDFDYQDPLFHTFKSYFSRRQMFFAHQWQNLWLCAKPLSDKVLHTLNQFEVLDSQSETSQKKKVILKNDHGDYVIKYVPFSVVAFVHKDFKQALEDFRHNDFPNSKGDFYKAIIDSLNEIIRVSMAYDYRNNVLQNLLACEDICPLAPSGLRYIWGEDDYRDPPLLEELSGDLTTTQGLSFGLNAYSEFLEQSA